MERLLARVGDDEDLTKLLQGRAHRHGGALVVIDNEDFRLRRRNRFGRRRRIHGLRRFPHGSPRGQFCPATERNVTTLSPVAPIAGVACCARWNQTRKTDTNWSMSTGLAT